MDELTGWLMEGALWMQYGTRLHLLAQFEDDPSAFEARGSMLDQPEVQSLIAERGTWPSPPLRGHNDASHLLHRLAFAADLGLRASDQGLQPVIERILDSQSAESAFQVVVNIPARYGGKGENQTAWMLCDAPLVLYALARFGLSDDRRARGAAKHLAGLVASNGWGCTVTPELGGFRGPGRKGDPCPYATLLALKALQQFAEWRDSAECRSGAESLLSLWGQRKERRPYMFAMGSDFQKLKAPLIWYDILHVADTLTGFGWLKEERRLRELVDIIRAKADSHGRFRPESIWRAWTGWDFGQKREPSRWITLIARRILRRMAGADERY